jgi:hypothetical protein
MREVKSHCHRCGETVLDNGLAVLGSTAGWLRSRLPESIDLCRGCGESFMRWSRERELDQVPAAKPAAGTLTETTGRCAAGVCGGCV